MDLKFERTKGAVRTRTHTLAMFVPKESITFLIKLTN